MALDLAFDWYCSWIPETCLIVLGSVLELSRSGFLLSCQSYFRIDWIPFIEELGYLFPFIAMLFMRLKNYPLFLLGPVFFIDLGVEMIIPP